MHPLAKLPCPVCQEATDSLKSYRLILFLLFIGIGASHKSATVVACPSCMRKRLLKLALVNLIPGNVLWVILLVPWYSIAALMSLTQGHSSSVVKAMEG
jgi:hypothetical protein